MGSTLSKRPQDREEDWKELVHVHVSSVKEICHLIEDYVGRQQYVAGQEKRWIQLYLVSDWRSFQHQNCKVKAFLDWTFLEVAKTVHCGQDNHESWRFIYKGQFVDMTSRL